jgi:adenine deaminase
MMPGFIDAHIHIESSMLTLQHLPGLLSSMEQ